MTANTTDPLDTLTKFQGALKEPRDSVPTLGKWSIEITRADGSVERRTVNNIVTKDGLNILASRGVDDSSSPFKYIAIGTATAAGSLGSVQGGLGEVSRKIASTIASSNEVMVLVATWAGNTDSLTGIALGTAGVINHASSGSGLLGNHVNSVDATLAASDFLKVQCEIQIGSHAL